MVTDAHKTLFLDNLNSPEIQILSPRDQDEIEFTLRQNQKEGGWLQAHVYLRERTPCYHSFCFHFRPPLSPCANPVLCAQCLLSTHQASWSPSWIHWNVPGLSALFYGLDLIYYNKTTGKSGNRWQASKDVLRPIIHWTNYTMELGNSVPWLSLLNFSLVSILKTGNEELEALRLIGHSSLGGKERMWCFSNYQGFETFSK